MKNLERHVSHLLAKNNCVIMPGFGAFLAHRIPAHYNIDEHIFMPPHRTIGFNAGVNVDDALLASAYMASMHTTYDKATEALGNDIKSLRNVLMQKGTARFGELGTFSMNINNEVVFEAANAGIDDPDYFGFEPLAIEQLHSDDTITIRKKDIGKYIATVAAVILAFLFVTPVSDNTFSNELRASLGEFAAPELISRMQQFVQSTPSRVADDKECEIRPIESLTESSTPAEDATVLCNNTEKTASIFPQCLDVANEPVDMPATAVSTIKYHIIVASSPNAENAQLAIKELTAKKTAEYSVVQCGKRHRVSIGSYDSEKEALASLPQVQQTFPDAWILSH